MTNNRMLTFLLQAARYRGPRSAVGANPTLYNNKAARFEARALEYERKGNHAKAQRNRERAWKTREKHSIAHPAGSRHPNTYPNYNQQMSMLPVTGVYPTAGMHSTTGVHPTGVRQPGYTKMSREQKLARFENKAQQWERQNNAAKAQKNREKVCISASFFHRALFPTSLQHIPSLLRKYGTNFWVTGCPLSWTQVCCWCEPWRQGCTL